MPWVTSIRVADSKTVSPRQYESARAEREFILSFAPGELGLAEAEKVKMYFREMESLVKLAIEEAISGSSDVREPSKSGAPPREEPKHEGRVPAGKGDRMEDWPKKIKCANCGTEREVKPNCRGEPYAICCGHFLNKDGTAGNPTSQPKKT